MKEYMNGEVDASTYKPKGAFWSGFGVGAASFVLGKYSPTVPFAFGISVGQISPKNEKLDLKMQSEYYIKGYKKVAKRKRMVNAFLGGAAGLALSLTTSYFLID